MGGHAVSGPLVGLGGDKKVQRFGKAIVAGVATEVVDVLSVDPMVGPQVCCVVLSFIVIMFTVMCQDGGAQRWAGAHGHTLDKIFLPNPSAVITHHPPVSLCRSWPRRWGAVLDWCPW